MQLVEEVFKSMLLKKRGRDYAIGDALSYTDAGLGRNASAVVLELKVD